MDAEPRRGTASLFLAGFEDAGAALAGLSGVGLFCQSTFLPLFVPWECNHVVAGDILGGFCTLARGVGLRDLEGFAEGRGENQLIRWKYGLKCLFLLVKKNKHKYYEKSVYTFLYCSNSCFLQRLQAAGSAGTERHRRRACRASGVSGRHGLPLPHRPAKANPCSRWLQALLPEPLRPSRCPLCLAKRFV